MPVSLVCCGVCYPDGTIQCTAAGPGGAQIICAVNCMPLSSACSRVIGACFTCTTCSFACVILPNATTLPTGSPSYVIKNLNSGTNPILLVKDFSGTTLSVVSPTGSATLSLIDNTTTSGTWNAPVVAGNSPTTLLCNCTYSAAAATSGCIKTYIDRNCNLHVLSLCTVNICCQQVSAFTFKTTSGFTYTNGTFILPECCMRCIIPARNGWLMFGSETCCQINVQVYPDPGYNPAGDQITVALNCDRFYVINCDSTCVLCCKSAASDTAAGWPCYYAYSPGASFLCCDGSLVPYYSTHASGTILALCFHGDGSWFTYSATPGNSKNAACSPWVCCTNLVCLQVWCVNTETTGLPTATLRCNFLEYHCSCGCNFFSTSTSYPMYSTLPNGNPCARSTNGYIFGTACAGTCSGNAPYLTAHKAFLINTSNDLVCTYMVCCGAVCDGILTCALSINGSGGLCFPSAMNDSNFVYHGASCTIIHVVCSRGGACCGQQLVGFQVVGTTPCLYSLIQSYGTIGSFCCNCGIGCMLQGASSFYPISCSVFMTVHTPAGFGSQCFCRALWGVCAYSPFRVALLCNTPVLCYIPNICVGNCAYGNIMGNGSRHNSLCEPLVFNYLEAYSHLGDFTTFAGQGSNLFGVSYACLCCGIFEDIRCVCNAGNRNQRYYLLCNTCACTVWYSPDWSATSAVVATGQSGATCFSITKYGYTQATNTLTRLKTVYLTGFQAQACTNWPYNFCWACCRAAGNCVASPQCNCGTFMCMGTADCLCIYNGLALTSFRVSFAGLDCTCATLDCCILNAVCNYKTTGVCKCSWQSIDTANTVQHIAILCDCTSNTHSLFAVKTCCWPMALTCVGSVDTACTCGRPQCIYWECTSCRWISMGAAWTGVPGQTCTLDLLTGSYDPIGGTFSQSKLCVALATTLFGSSPAGCNTLLNPLGTAAVFSPCNTCTFQAIAYLSVKP